MPATLSYPGIYIEEIPSGVHTITGVSTSDTAFIDVFQRGPVNLAVRMTSFADFVRVFGGLDTRSEASYAIQQFYLNGGAVAWVVRIAPSNAVAASLTLVGSSPAQNTLTVTAGQMGPNNTIISNPGKWGNNLQVAATQVQPPDGKTFNLFIREVVQVNNRPQVVNSETYRNLTMDKTNTRYALNIVNNSSALIYLTDVGLGAPPSGPMLNPDGSVPDSAWQNLQNGDDGSVLNTDGSLVDPSGILNALIGDANSKTGLYALDAIAPYTFNILCIPIAAKLDGITPVDNNITTQRLSSLVQDAEGFCEDKRAFFIVDLPQYVDTPDKITKWTNTNPLPLRNAAVYFPRLQILDAANANMRRDVGPSGTLAGVYARTDSTRGVWKAPAGTEAILRGANIVVLLTDLENGGLNSIGINVLRNFPIFGNISWGARTLEGADQQASEWKYIPVRRTALYIEESLYQGLKWVVFEPNDEPLWAQIRLNVGAFMHNLFRQGAFQGTKPTDAYFVKCDKETTTQDDINKGIVNIVVGFAPLKPAEFVVIKIQQIAGRVQT